MSPRPPWRRAAAGANLIGSDGSLSPTIFEEMTVLAQRTGAINLGQGFPDQEGPARMVEEACRAISTGHNQYAPGSGLPVLRSAVAEHQRRFYGLAPDPEAGVVVTTGATEAIAAAVLAFVEPGDEVVTFEPFYDSYGAMVALAGGVHRTVPLRAPDFWPDPRELEAVVGPRTRLILLNNPHNPTGAVFGREVLEDIVRVAVKHDCLIVSDEVYEHLVYDGAHLPIASIDGAWDRTITISSAGKTFSYTGWKVGWASGPADLVAAVRTVKQFLSYSSGPAFQPAVAAALGSDDGFYEGFRAQMRTKRDLLVSALSRTGMRVREPNGTYFVVADLAPLGFDDAVSLAREWPVSAGVAAIPLSVFCHPDGARLHRSLMRFAFCKREDVLLEAGSRLAVWAGGLA